MTISEVRFQTPGRAFYTQGIALSALGIALIACGVVIVAIEPWNLVHAIYIVSGIFVGLVGVGFTLLVWFLYAWGAISTWWLWRQFRPPAVVIDASGVRYLAARRPVLVPWPDIEKVGLERSVFRHRVVTKVLLRLAPGAALLRDHAIPVPASRSLNVGTMSRIAVPEDTALRFLAATAKTRLEITEVDRRTPAASPARD
jgi:hypothetical protein